MAFQLNKDFTLSVLDQTRLPQQEIYILIKGPHDAYKAIKEMKVRGAPCIAAIACLSLFAEQGSKKLSQQDLLDATKTLLGARPTAVNLKNAINHIIDIIAVKASMTYSETTDPKDPIDTSADPEKTEIESALLKAGLDESRKTNLVEELKNVCVSALETGYRSNKQLAKNGFLEIMTNAKKDCVSVLTHCNTGTLATVHLGTAYGIIKEMHDGDKLHRLYYTETRPYLQGARLTSWECVKDDIRATLITDSMVAHLMATRRLDAVIVGADCVAANGDTANKIGTHQIAIVAKHFNVPFYIAAPVQSFDLSLENMASIPIEERPAEELRKIGNHQIVQDNVRVWNPGFDVTPANLITSIITQYGVVKADKVSIKEFFEKIADKIEFEF